MVVIAGPGFDRRLDGAALCNGCGQPQPTQFLKGENYGN